MPAKLNVSDTIALLCSVDAKFENSFNTLATGYGDFRTSVAKR